ncbi:hypothetical protein PCANC_26143 [Puccinia coronata f. sp. avenae]|uniref:F-box domain-containing protein n=1 Tax=Puccinia coronata f. sp. avenae TaxID=200324 RepID=A0A2N5RY32_9BASI|nr:hypothetical protein PCANC_26143 [Puccinia coronata f. sp. avenae]
MVLATLSDLPAELVNRIIHHVFYDSNPPSNPNIPRPTCTPSPDHHALDHTEINDPKRKPRPHDERIIPRSRSPKKYHEPVSWPKGLPFNPLVSLSLVNHTFRLCAQELLFKNVALQDTRTNNMFLKSLTSVPADEDHSARKRQKRGQHLGRLSQYVQSLQFKWGGKRSTGKTGASLFCKILQNCPLLENLLICNKIPLANKELILEALARNPSIKDIVIFNVNELERDNSIFQWQADEVVTRLFSHWNGLETIELWGLTGWASNARNAPPKTLPALNCAIRTVILMNHNCNELTFSNLLKSCGESVRTLQITGSHLNLKPGAFGRVLRDSTSFNLECLAILEPSCWEHTVNDLDREKPDDVANVLDIAFDSPTALKNLKTLSFYGRYMATDQLFARLPKSLVKLAWEQCKLTAPPFIEALASSTDDKGSLPNLMCCSVRTHRGWDVKDEMTVRKILEKMRGGCFHLLRHRGYGSPSSTDSDRSRSYLHDPYDNWEE